MEIQKRDKKRALAKLNKVRLAAGRCKPQPPCYGLLWPRRLLD